MKTWPLLFLAVSTFAQTGTIVVSGRLTVTGSQGGILVGSALVTNTQALLAYTAPTTSSCTVDVSESSGYVPLVHDVDSTIFGSGANSDTRAGSLTSGMSRQFVIGKRVAERGTNSRWYSRALKINTLHYYRITCGVAVATGTFTTANLPLGNTYTEVLPTDPLAASRTYSSTVGFYGHPEFTKWDKSDPTARSETIADPNTGIGLKRVFLPQDQPVTFAPAGDRAFNAASGSAWTNPTNVLADDGSAATYSGTGSDFLFVSDSTFPAVGLDSLDRPTDYLYLGIKAWCSVGACVSADATIQVCLTIDGTTCWPSNATAKFQELALGTSTSPSLAQVGSTVPILDSWTPAGYDPLTRVDLKTSGALGWLIRKKTGSTDQINIQYARYTYGTSLLPDWPASGSAGLCSSTLTQNSVTGGLGYTCVFKSSGNDMTYWIDHATQDANYLGFFSTGSLAGSDGWGNGNCTGTRTLSGTTPTANESVYCSTSDNSGKPIILSCAVSSTHQPGNLSVSCTNMTIGTAGKDFWSLLTAFAASDTPTYSSTMFPACAINGKQGTKLVMTCSMTGNQDQLAWRVVFDPALVSNATGCVGSPNPGCVIASQPSWAVAPARWCVNHTSFVSGPTDIVWTAGKFFLDFGIAGMGPYTSAITSGSLASATGAIAPGSGLCPAGTLRCDTVTVDGEPCDTSPHGIDPLNCPKNGSYSYLQNAVVGDIFQIDNEWIRLANKAGNSWTFQRGYGFRGASTHGGSTVAAYCSSQDFTHDYTNWSFTWDSAADPHGANAGGTSVLVAWDYDHPTPYPTQTVGGDAYWDTNCTTSPCYAIRKTGALGDPPDTLVAGGPAFAGKQGTSKSFVEVEDHPGWLQESATTAEKQWLFDGRPLQPNQEISDVASLQSGQLYKLVSTTSDGDNLTHVGGAGSPNPTIGEINRKIQPTWAFCGSQPLLDISGPTTGNVIGTTSADSFKYCISRLANECRSGAIQGDVWVNCPNQSVRAGVGTYGCSNQISNPKNDICLSNGGAYLNNIAQVGFGTNDLTGLLGRSMTNGLTRYKLIDGFWSAQSAPDASFMIFRSMWLGGAWPDVLVAKIPPYPATDSVVRTTFVGVDIPVAAVGGATNAIIRWGYAENGAFDAFRCTSRQEICIANANGVQTIPFQYQLSDGSGAETGITGLACSGGCTVTLPGISGRMIYLQKVWRNSSGNATVQTGSVELRIVP